MTNFLKLPVRYVYTSLILLALTGCQYIDNNPKDMVNHGYIEAGDAKLYYEILGVGKPIIVLHGGPGLDQAYLRPQMDELAKDYQLIYFDQRGSGKSFDTTLTEETINMDQFIDDIETVRQHFGLDKMTLLGHSWGGYLSLNYAVKHQDHLNKLIVMSSSPIDGTGNELLDNNFHQRTESVSESIQPLFSQEKFFKLNANEISNVYRSVFTPYMSSPQHIDELTLEFNITAAQNGFIVSTLMEKSGCLSQDIDLKPALSNVSVPTLVIHGKEDLVPFEGAVVINDTLPNSNLIAIEGSGHFTYINGADETFNAIREFLN